MPTPIKTHVLEDSSAQSYIAVKTNKMKRKYLKVGRGRVDRSVNVN